jgi:hypothetical protein
MPADPGSGTNDGGTSSGPAAPNEIERRRDPLFRSLIDDMMQQIRELRAHAGPWPPDERAKVEADLERIMAQVRNAALRSGE